MFYQCFLSLQVKRMVIIRNKHGIYEFSNDLPNDMTLDLRKLGNIKISKLQGISLAPPAISPTPQATPPPGQPKQHARHCIPTPTNPPPSKPPNQNFIDPLSSGPGQDRSGQIAPSCHYPPPAQPKPHGHALHSNSPKPTPSTPSTIPMPCFAHDKCPHPSLRADFGSRKIYRRIIS